MSLEGMYQELILDHHRNPVGKGLRDPFDAQVHHINTSCGDELTVRVHLQSGEIVDISWDGVGCAISQASMSMLADMCTSQPTKHFHQLLEAFLAVMHGRGQVAPDPILADAAAFEGVAQFAARVKCALLGWMAVEDAVNRASSTVIDLRPEQEGNA